VGQGQLGKGRGLCQRPVKALQLKAQASFGLNATSTPRTQHACMQGITRVPLIINLPS
jgi:hypothetical protein